MQVKNLSDIRSISKANKYIVTIAIIENAQVRSYSSSNHSLHKITFTVLLMYKVKGLAITCAQ